jgi:hypothetical protein
VNGGQTKGNAILKQMYSELVRSAAKYPNGCLAKVVPAAVASP